MTNHTYTQLTELTLSACKSCLFIVSDVSLAMASHTRTPINKHNGLIPKYNGARSYSSQRPKSSDLHEEISHKINNGKVSSKANFKSKSERNHNSPTPRNVSIYIRKATQLPSPELIQASIASLPQCNFDSMDNEDACVQNTESGNEKDNITSSSNATPSFVSPSPTLIYASKASDINKNTPKTITADNNSSISQSIYNKLMDNHKISTGSLHASRQVPDQDTKSPSKSSHSPTLNAILKLNLYQTSPHKISNNEKVSGETNSKSISPSKLSRYPPKSKKVPFYKPKPQSPQMRVIKSSPIPRSPESDQNSSCAQLLHSSTAPQVGFDIADKKSLYTQDTQNENSNECR